DEGAEGDAAGPPGEPGLDVAERFEARGDHDVQRQQHEQAQAHEHDDAEDLLAEGLTHGRTPSSTGRSTGTAETRAAGTAAAARSWRCPRRSPRTGTRRCRCGS